ncbi:MAG: ABC transporter ATP-binding protein [Deltaproteobacteria bacterium]|nr:ABC transporter ATP-binding protein [Deltaproteobacteria bacterium]
MIETKDLTYSVEDKKILEGVTFRMEQGDFVALLGPNGSGKTTLIKILSGVYRDYSGAANLNLMHIGRMRSRGIAQFVSVVPQEAHFAFPFTALEVVLMGRQAFQKNFSFDSAEDLQIASRAMERTDCRQFADRKISTLSGGEKQRVLLARALAQKPRFLLLDEPASHLDLKHQGDLFRLLVDLNRSDGIAVLCVVHDLNLASLYAKRLLCLKEGRLVLQGETGEVLTEENIRKVFGIPCRKLASPDGHSYFFPERVQ